jgi:hypothetical protein
MFTILLQRGGGLMGVRWSHWFLVAALLLTPSGCQLISFPGVQRHFQHVTLTYGHGDVPPTVRTNIVNQLREGTMQITDARIGGSIGCEAIDSANMKFKLYGSLGANGTNSTLRSSAFSMDQRIPSPPAPVCQMTPENIVQSLTILAGGGSPGLQVGVAETAPTVNITINDTTYTANDSYAQFVVESFNQLTDFTTGRFEFLGINHANPRDPDVLVVSGTFAIVED